MREQERLLDALADGLWSLHDRDYSVSIAAPDDARLQRLVAGYNGLGAKLRSQRQDLYQRELLLDTVIQASPLALLLTNATGTILYGNLAARQLLGAGKKLEGLALAPLLADKPAALRDALEGSHDQLFTAQLGEDAGRAGIELLAVMDDAELVDQHAIEAGRDLVQASNSSCFS